ncbi:MAG: bifunctional diaminohydroxyphosphoribosylaminopyrimidine deaminase/5-amino-6-(5-phosphoribosylamino)uracil reductase RibD [Pyrinomonadaceae bacterium]
MMRRAFDLAARGLGQVSPGPLVGCVIVGSGDEIVGSGFYLYEQISHAERIALDEAGEEADGGTAYITLEPHAHHGRTPPCTDALIRAGIRRVVSATIDDNPLVNGKGYDQLRAAGVEVVDGVLRDESLRLNEKYNHFMRTGFPFVHLKLATSLDGKIATRSGDSQWITGEEARARVHRIRHEYDAIIVGAGTAEIDNPHLTDRSGQNRHRRLARVVVDSRLRLRPETNLCRTAHENPVIVFTTDQARETNVKRLEACGVEIVRVSQVDRLNTADKRIDLRLVLENLGQRKITSLLVEGGAALAASFIEAKLVNKVSFFIAPKIIGGCDATSAIAGIGAGKVAESFELCRLEVTEHGRDLEVSGYPL